MVATDATSLRRGLAILFALAGEEAGRNGGLGVTRIAELIGRDKSLVSRTLKVLGEYGVVERDGNTREYRIGPRLLAFAGGARSTQLVTEAEPALRRLVRELGETTHLSLLHGRDVLTLLSESPNHAVQASGWVGRTVPAFCTSSGRALLLDRGLPELGDLFAGVDFAGAGPNAPRDVAELHARIVAARVRGVAIADEEFETGLVAAGAPVRGHDGAIVAALNVSAPKFRFGDRLDAAGDAVKAAADVLSMRLGWPGHERQATA